MSETQELAIQLLGDDALTPEEVRVILSGGPYGAAPPQDKRTWKAAMQKIVRSRDAALNPPVTLVKAPSGVPLSRDHRNLLKLASRKPARMITLCGPQKQELAEDLQEEGLLELVAPTDPDGLLGARITPQGTEAIS